MEKPTHLTIASSQDFPLKRSGSDGNDGGMDTARIDALEKRFDKFEGKFETLQKEVVELRVQIATLTERIAHLPSKEFIYKGIAGLVTLIGGIVVLAPKIQAWLGVIPSP